jgi:prephenate dehydrogenase
MIDTLIENCILTASKDEILRTIDILNERLKQIDSQADEEEEEDIREEFEEDGEEYENE